MRMILLLEQIEKARHAHDDADPLVRPCAEVGRQPVVVEVVRNEVVMPQAASSSARARKSRRSTSAPRPGGCAW